MPLRKSGDLLSSLMEGPKQYCLIFWLGGAGFLFLKYGIVKCLDKFNEIAEAGGGEAFGIFGILFIIVASAHFVEKFNLVVLRFVQGLYYPILLRAWINKKKDRWYKKKDDEYQKLLKLEKEAEKRQETLPLKDSEKSIKLDTLLRHLPKIDSRLPTKIGNILRRAELHPLEYYGLDSKVCFPRLWLLLPKNVRTQVDTARKMLENASVLWAWGLLFMLWGFVCWIAIPISWVLMIIAYRGMLDKAESYAHLIESCFDIYRPLLYEALRLTLPSNPDDERKQGDIITTLLWRGD